MMHHGIRLAILGSLFLALLVSGRAVLGETIAYQQTNLVTLYAALGGGLDHPAAAPPATPAG